MLQYGRHFGSAGAGAGALEGTLLQLIAWLREIARVEYKEL
jgi:hypothetical protein